MGARGHLQQVPKGPLRFRPRMTGQKLAPVGLFPPQHAMIKEAYQSPRTRKLTTASIGNRWPPNQ